MSYKEELMMILKNQIITNIKIESVNDLYKFKPFLEDGTLKINKSFSSFSLISMASSRLVLSFNTSRIKQELINVHC